MGSRQTDSEVITASQVDPRKFILLFDRYFDVIHRYLRRRVGKDIADDLAAQTFAEAFDHRASFDDARADALPWLFGITLNLLRHHYRDEERQLRAFARRGADPVATSRDVAGDAAVGSQLAEALGRLRVEDRDVLLLFAWGELSYHEIAEALQLPLGTVRSRLNRARRQLRDRLKKPETPSRGAPETEDHKWMISS